jgi:signal transduction histidine kinase
MPKQASERLKRLNGEIMRAWENRAIEEVAAALRKDSLALRDSLPEFLDQIVLALDTKVERSKVRVKWERDENTRVGKKHGRERAGTLNYTMDQLIVEYHILRQTICELMEVEAPLSPLEREVIVCAVEQAVNDAATEFSDTLSDIQEKFTHTLAHDLRGPITAAKLNAELQMKLPEKSAPYIKLANRISISMDRLGLMISDLLDGAKIRAGQALNLVLENCDIEIILKQVVDELNFLHGDRISLKSPGPVIGHWNEGALRRVIDNLIGNALKFSPENSAIELELKRSGGFAELSVHNSGTPIPDEEKSVLFQQYRRARNSKGKVGWGLGLLVVKGVTEALGGSVAVESSAASGTTFNLLLPLQEGPSLAPSNGVSKGAEARG